MLLCWQLLAGSPSAVETAFVLLLPLHLQQMAPKHHKFQA
jgi:hypothetical protein